MARLAFSICQAKQNSKGIQTFKANRISHLDKNWVSFITCLYGFKKNFNRE